MAQIHELIGSIAKEISSIGKNQSNKQQGFKYRGIDDVYNMIQPLLAKYGVFTMPTVVDEKSEERQTKSGGNLIYRILKMQYDFYAPDGSAVACIVIGEGMDSGDKAANKAMAVAHKYAILQTFCVPTQDLVDPDSESHEVKPRNASASPAKKVKFATAEQYKLLKAVMDKLNIADDVRSTFGQWFRAGDQLTEAEANVLIPTISFFWTAFGKGMSIGDAGAFIKWYVEDRPMDKKAAGELVENWDQAFTDHCEWLEHEANG